MSMGMVTKMYCGQDCKSKKHCLCRWEWLWDTYYCEGYGLQASVSKLLGESVRDFGVLPTVWKFKDASSFENKRGDDTFGAVKT
jgi:hypothetical protein